MFPLSDDLKAECLECGVNASLRCIGGKLGHQSAFTRTVSVT